MPLGNKAGVHSTLALNALISSKVRFCGGSGTTHVDRMPRQVCVNTHVCTSYIMYSTSVYTDIRKYVCTYQIGEQYVHIRNTLYTHTHMYVLWELCMVKHAYRIIQ